MALNKLNAAVTEFSQYFQASSRCTKEINRVSFEWKIENFSLCFEKQLRSSGLRSPSFTAFSGALYLLLCPENGMEEFEIRLIKESNLISTITCIISIKGKNEEYDYTKKTECSFCNHSSFRVNYIKASKILEEKKDQFLPDDILTICCELTRIKVDFLSNAMPTIERDKGCSTLPAIVSLEKLASDLGAAYQNAETSDFVLKAEGQEFFVHKIILTARSPVFAAMFKHDMKEKQDNEVIISDVNATILDQLLRFLYTGKPGDMTFESAVGLFAAADKYAVDDLKEKCRNVIMGNLSADNVCDVVVLGATHEDENLNESVKTFLRSNISAVKSTKQWNALRRDRPDLALNILEDICSRIYK